MKGGFLKKNNYIGIGQLFRRGFFFIIFPLFIIGYLVIIFVPSVFEVPEEVVQIKAETVHILNEVGFQSTADLSLKRHTKSLLPSGYEGVSQFTIDDEIIEVKWVLLEENLTIMEIRNKSKLNVLYTVID